LNNLSDLAQKGQELGTLELAQLYTMPVGIFGVFGAIILTSNIIVGELESGVAHWILSKPISRFSYIFSKTVANIIGIFLTMFPVQAVLTYFIYNNSSELNVTWMSLVAVVLTLFLHVLFYISLTVLCNVLFTSRIAILAIPFGIFFLQQILINSLMKHKEFFPYNLVLGATDRLSGGSEPLLFSVLFTLFLSIVFVIISVQIFKDKEL
jgi:ABC-type transport system involved in multi-copper enzyme maturation permease subunit